MNSFFGIYAAAGTVEGMTLALILSVLLGGLIGLEREMHGHPAGLRTHILVCVGSALITLVSVRMAMGVPGGRADPGRIAAQIVSGIGFLGAGAIIREGASVRGLTTAASIWTTAGIGIALGAGPFFGQLAIITTVIVLFTLWVLNLLESRIERSGHHAHTVNIEARDTEHACAHAIARVASHGIEITSMRQERGEEMHSRMMTLRVKLPTRFDRAEFMAEMTEVPGVIAVTLD